MQESEELVVLTQLEQAELRVQEARDVAVLHQRRAQKMQAEANAAQENEGILSKLLGQREEIDRKVQDAEDAQREAYHAVRDADRAEKEYKKVCEDPNYVAKLALPRSSSHSPRLGSPREQRAYTPPLRKMSAEDAEAIKFYSQQNQSLTGWFKRTVLNSPPEWPRLLYVNIIGCSALPGPNVIGTCNPYVRITNATTRQNMQTQVALDDRNPTFDEVYIVTANGASDTIVLEVYNHGEGTRDEFIGAALLPLDIRFICQREVGLELLDKQKQLQGVVRVESFWVDEAQPQKEEGEFYYKVVHKNGVALRKEPELDAPKTKDIMQPGEVFKVLSRQKDMSDGTIYVEVTATTDRWARSGWVFETYQGEPVLQRMSPPRRVVDQFFYKVKHAEGARLYQSPDVRSGLLNDIIPQGAVIEASEKVTQIGSEITFVKVDIDRGYIFEKSDASIVMNKRGEPIFEVVPCPEGEVVSQEQGHFIYRVTVASGIYARQSPDIVSAAAELLPKGTPFAATAKILKRYPGLGEVLFVQRAKDECWVRATKSGMNLLERIVDRVEQGPFNYVITHDNGVVVRAGPDLNAPPAKPQMVLAPRKTIVVRERIVKAEEIVTSDTPTVFLQLEDESGWVFEKRGDVRICEQLRARPPGPVRRPISPRTNGGA